MKFPNNKKFAFTIVDDTDGATFDIVKNVYDFLAKHGFKTTKTIWIYEPRNNFKGATLQDKEFTNYLKELLKQGFEIALHNVGSGSFTRDEICAGFDHFFDVFGFYPKMHINHATNPDNIYWGHERYANPLKFFVKLLYGQKRKFNGNDPTSIHFWGDIHKKHIQYTRNYVFNGINTIKYDKKMPYLVESKIDYSNYWFSSSDAQSVKEFLALVSPRNIKKLEQEGGVCIVYTHFGEGYVGPKGNLDADFKNAMLNLSKNENCWFAPASEILDFLLKSKTTKSNKVSEAYLRKLDFKWLVGRIIKKIKFGK